MVAKSPSPNNLPITRFTPKSAWRLAFSFEKLDALLQTLLDDVDQARSDADSLKQPRDEIDARLLALGPAPAAGSAREPERASMSAMLRTVIAHSMALVLIQRLARRLCPSCTVTGEVPELLYDSLIARKLYDPKHPVPLPRAVGCEACDDAGLLGRVSVIESMRLTDQIRSMRMANRPLGEVIALARETGALVQFPQYASFMMEQKIISPAEAFLSVAS